ncbi:MAG: von Willebrand factor type A domain-containing protein [Candidatus Omnitrophica bacterium]|nr:von Willebrand factor type A domain-containing protein [Candidatus Omnitrophota bacterium]
MNNREDLKQLISAYIDGETTPEEKERVETLLATDAEAKKYYNNLKNLSSSLRTWSNEALSPDLEQKLNKDYLSQKIEEGRAMKAKTKRTVAVASTVLIALVVFSVSLDVYKRNVQGRLKSATDEIGEQYQPAQSQPVATTAQTTVSAPITAVTPVTVTASAPVPTVQQSAPSNGIVKSARARTEGVMLAKAVETKQYEPYYMDQSYNVNKAEGATRSAKSVTLGFQADSSAKGGRMLYDQVQVVAPAFVGPTVYYGQPVDTNTEQYDQINENEYQEAMQNPLSTFSIDVDTASYSNIRRFLESNQMPPEDSVRIEEMINYFSYEYPEPTGEDPFSITTEVAACPWNTTHKLALIGLQGKRLKGTEMPSSNLVFLIDVSGSMQDQNKLPLLQQAFRMMVQQLRAEDTVSIVVYAGAAGQVLEPTSGDQKQKILSAINSLSAGGSTAGAEGIQMAYELAKKNYIKGGNNRVVLATDGDFNVGVSNDGELVRIIEEKRKEGIFLTILGVGMGNYKDSKMQKLADKGNGNYYYIDTLKEAKKVLVQELGSALFTIAKDVKIQVEFNPSQVKAYRLVGYEKRMLNKEDFNDDTKDAGELGIGHTVTALYEIIPADSKEPVASVDALKYQTTQVKTSEDLLTVKLRYKKPEENESKLLSRVVSAKEVVTQMSNNLSWASAVSEFGMILRNSKFKASSSYADTLTRAQASKGEDKFGYRQEMIDLIQKAESLDVRVTTPGGGISTK